MELIKNILIQLGTLHFIHIISYHIISVMTVADMVIGFAVAWKIKLLSFAPIINNNYDFVGAGQLMLRRGYVYSLARKFALGQEMQD